MYKILIIILFSLILPQYDWDDNGLPIRQGIHIEWQRTGDYGDNGTMIFAWSDTRYGGRDVYAQKVDQNGNSLWGSEGVPIVIGPGRQEDPILVTDGNGGAFVIWVDYRDEPDNGDIYAQHINSDGVISWDIEGVVLTNVIGKQASPNMCSDGQGGAFVIWNDLSVSTLGHTYGTHLTTNESDIVAQGTGVPLIANDSDHSGVSIEVAAPGSAVMVWTDDRNLDNSDLDIYTQRIDVNCNTLWSSPEDGGIPLCNSGGIQQYAKVTYYSNTASVVVWEDKRANPNSGDVYVQYVDMDGNILLNIEGEPICTNEANQIKPRVKADSQGAYIVWEDKRNGPGDIYLQRHVLDSGSQFEADGLGLCTAFSSQDQPRLTTDGFGGAFVVWMDERFATFPETEIFMQHINSDGSVSFEDDGLSVCSAPQYQFNPLVRHDGNGNAFAVWGDARSGSIGLYSQYISTQTGASLQEDGVELYFGIDGNGLSANSLYLGNNETMLYWEDKRLGVFADLTYGQKVYQGWEDVVTPNGIKLSDNMNQVSPNAEKLGDNVFLGFADAEFDLVLHYQLLDENLTMIGDSNGSPVFESFTPQNSYDLKATSNGTLAFVFSDQRNFIDNDIYVQYYNQDGSAVLSEPALIVDNFFIDDNVRFIETDDDSGNILIVYDSGDFSGTRVYAAMIDNSGSVLWNYRLSSEESDQFARGVVKTSNGFFVIWKDQRSGSADIYGQMIDSNGSLLGDSGGVAITVENNDQQAPTLSWNSVNESSVVCWEDFRNGIDFDIYCAEINDYSLEVNNFDLCVVAGSNQKTPNVYSAISGSNLFAWEDSRNGVTSDLFYQEMSSNGSMVHDDNGIVLCDADFNQLSPKIDIYDEVTNSYIIYWDDMRSSGKEDLSNIYLQSVSIGSEQCVASGDNNFDSFVNVLDIVSVVGYITGNGSFDDSQMCAADLNYDGVVNVIDIVSLVNIIIAP